MNQAESHLSLETDNPLEQGNINNKNMATCCCQNIFIKYNCLKETVSPMIRWKIEIFLNLLASFSGYLKTEHY